MLASYMCGSGMSGAGAAFDLSVEGGQSPQLIEVGHRSVLRHQVEDDLVGAGRDATIDPFPNGGDVTPGDDRIEQPVRPWRLEVIGRPAQTEEVVPIVLGTEVETRVRVADRSRLGAVGGQDDGEIGSQK